MTTSMKFCERANCLDTNYLSVMPEKADNSIVAYTVFHLSFTIEPDDIVVENTTDSSIRVVVKKTESTGQGSEFPHVHYVQNRATERDCPLSNLNTTHEICTIHHQVPATQHTLRFRACGRPSCTYFSSSQTVWTLPSSKLPFLLKEGKQT